MDILGVVHCLLKTIRFWVLFQSAVVLRVRLSPFKVQKVQIEVGFNRFSFFNV